MILNLMPEKENGELLDTIDLYENREIVLVKSSILNKDEIIELLEVGLKNESDEIYRFIPIKRHVHKK